MNCKNAVIIFLVFIIFSLIVCFVPEISEYDISIIEHVQAVLNGVSKNIPIAAGGILFYIMTCLPLVAAGIYFLFNKMYKQLFSFLAVPFIAYFINSIIKWLVQRPRPPIELQFQEHMSSSSYVSRHTFVTACVWGVFIYLVCKHCQNKFLRHILIVLSVFWIFFEGFSRVWMGVHNSTDVIGALILSIVFIILYTKII